MLSLIIFLLSFSSYYFLKHLVNIHLLSGSVILVCNMFGVIMCSSFLGSGSTLVFFISKHIPWWVSDSSGTVLVIGWEEWPFATLQQQALHFAVGECSTFQPLSLPLDIFVRSQVGSFGVPAGDCSHICDTNLKACVNWSNRGEVSISCQSVACELLIGFPVSLNPNASP